MGFEKTVPLWGAPGVEPPVDLKESGFTAGYKPPADFFNWFWHGVSECLAELQEGAVPSATLDNTDLNTLTETGMFGYALSCTNKPTTHSGAVIVHNYKTTYVLQFAFNHGTGGMYTRYSNTGGTSWTDWVTFYNSANLSAVVDRGVIADNTDLDTLQDVGFYHVVKNSTVATLTNCPTTKAFFMEVGKHAGAYQRIVEFDLTAPKVYFRNYYYEQGWGAWHREYTTANKPTAAEVGAHALSERGVQIPASSNLNDYKTPGDYFVSGANDATTITNTPIKGSGYRLIVEAGYVSDYVRQYAVGTSGNIQTRYYQTSWSDWVKIVNTYDLENTIHYHATKRLLTEDLNTVVVPGFYYGDGANTCANCPVESGSGFGLEVVQSAGGYYTQVVYHANTVFTRYYNSTSATWNDWRKTALLNTEGVLPMSQGGTGASTAKVARTNLGITSGALGIQAGQYYSTTAVGASSRKDYAITFPTAYKTGTIPNVVVCMDTASTSKDMGYLTAAVLLDSVTNTGFTIRLYNADDSDRTPSFQWMALGVPAE